jgi:hypothetical protein
MYLFDVEAYSLILHFVKINENLRIGSLTYCFAIKQYLAIRLQLMRENLNLQTVCYLLPEGGKKLQPPGNKWLNFV